MLEKNVELIDRSEGRVERARIFLGEMSMVAEKVVVRESFEGCTIAVASSEVFCVMTER